MTHRTAVAIPIQPSTFKSLDKRSTFRIKVTGIMSLVNKGGLLISLLVYRACR